MTENSTDEGLATKYPAYWKPLPPGWKAIDTYRVNELFPISGDASGRLLHARKKLLVPGTRTGGKTLYKDVQEAYDTLRAWLEDNVVQVEVDIPFTGGCCCTPKEYKGIWAAGPCPVHNGLRRLKP